MSAVPYSWTEPKRHRSKKSAAPSSRSPRNAKFDSLKTTAVASSSPTPKVEKIDKFRQLPVGLQLLLFFQQSSSVVTFCLIFATLTVYAWTVYIPKLWTQEYKKLETLQGNERLLTTTNETLKNQLAQQAERPEMGLAKPHPAQAIFFPSSLKKAVHQPPQPVQKNLALTVKPLAY